MIRHVAIFGLLGCFACSGGDSGKGMADAGASDADTSDAAAPDAAVPLTIDDICDRDNGMFVDFFNAALGCFPEFELFLGSLPDDQTFSDACYGQFGEHVLDGTITLGTLDDLARCGSVINAIDCQTFEFDAPNDCNGIFGGTLGQGADCDSDEQCSGDAFCDRSGGGSCGTCAARKPILATCQDNAECSSRHCSRAEGAQDGTCKAFGAIDESCVTNEDCSGHLECGAGNTCAAPRVWAADDICVSNDAGDCGFPTSEFFCEEGNGVCVAYLSLGTPCTGAFQCKFLKYESCDVGGSDTCIAPTIRALNESCSFASGDKCAVGLQCSDPVNTGTCLQQAQPGDSCTPNGGECGDFLLKCVNGECQYGNYTGECPAP